MTEGNEDSQPRQSNHPGPLFRNHNLGGASFKKGTSFLIQEIFLFMNSVGKLYFLQGTNYGRKPITTIMLFIFVIRTMRGFMDGLGFEKYGHFTK